jgi:hypothetical protein
MIFYFLWGDPVFSEPFDQLETWVDDTTINERRTLVLTALDYLGLICLLTQENQDENRKLKELSYQSAWREARLLKHVPSDVAERIWVDFNVNRLDPDFSFEKSVMHNDEKIQQRLATPLE